MESKYPPAKLGELLKYRKEFIKIDDVSIYKRVTAKLHSQGIFLRDEVEGLEIKTKNQQLCKSGDFLVAEIDAKVGGFGIIPEELEGAIVSSHYFLFEIDETRLNRQFLNYYLKTDSFQNQINAQGSTNYAAIRPVDILEIEIFLPSIKEQKSIVTILDRTMERVNEARCQRVGAVEDLLTLISRYHGSIFDNLSKLFPSKSMESISTIEMGQSPSGTSYNEIGEGVPLLNGPTEFGRIHPIETQWTSSPTKTCNEGDLLICVRGATTGKMNWADKKYCIGRGLAAINSNDQICDNKYLWYFLNIQTEIILSQTRGSTFPNLPSKQLKQLEAPIPPLNIQHQIVAHLDFLQAKVEELKKLQAETESDLNELVLSILQKAFVGGF